MTIDIDAIEARANAAGKFSNQKELLSLFQDIENRLEVEIERGLVELQDKTIEHATAELITDNAALCAELRETRAANERALRLLERVAAWRSGAVGSEWTAELSADIAALIYPDLPKMEGDK